MSTTQERVDGTVDGQRDAMQAILDRQRQAFVAEGPPSVAVRRNRIDRLLALVLDNADAFVDAMSADYGTRPKTGSLFTEVVGMISVIEHTRSHVPQWMRTTKLMRAARIFGLKAEVQPSPLGVVGIIGPWNYPIYLVVLPAAAAFAAGNRAMIKMSEITPRTAELMKSTAPKYFDPTELDIVTGGPEVSAAFSSLRFDHLFFTGSPSVGALVQQAAAQNLVPVTLELGGKNPVVVSPDADLKRSANRIAAARMINGGQVCICPDYVFVPDDRIDAFVDIAREAWRGMFPSIVSNDDFRTFVRRTRSGGVARNDFGAQMIPSAAPFGGVGRSGTGAYHGKAGFDAFSHYRSVVGTDLPFTITGQAAPPFSAPMRAGAKAALRMARSRTRRRLKRRR